VTCAQQCGNESWSRFRTDMPRARTGRHHPGRPSRCSASWGAGRSVCGRRSLVALRLIATLRGSHGQVGQDNREQDGARQCARVGARRWGCQACHRRWSMHPRQWSGMGRFSWCASTNVDGVSRPVALRSPVGSASWWSGGLDVAAVGLPFADCAHRDRDASGCVACAGCAHRGRGVSGCVACAGCAHRGRGVSGCVACAGCAHRGPDASGCAVEVFATLQGSRHR
jgi:hypothetical protein